MAVDEHTTTPISCHAEAGASKAMSVSSLVVKCVGLLGMRGWGNVGFVMRWLIWNKRKLQVKSDPTEWLCMCI